MEIVIKPWGREEIWIKTGKYAGKFLYIRKGEELSFQHHEVKEETIRVISGTLGVKLGLTFDDAFNSEPIFLYENATLHILPKTVHRFYAPVDDVCVLEISTPELDDIVRHFDKYGRA